MIKILFLSFFIFLSLNAQETKKLKINLDESCEIGTVDVGETYLVDVRFEEIKDAIQLKDVKTSCECIDVLEFPSVLKEGNGPLLLLQVDKVTRFKYDVSITFNDDSVKQFSIAGNSIKVGNKKNEAFSKLKRLGKFLLKGNTKNIDKSLYTFYKDVIGAKNKLRKNITIVDIRSKQKRRDIRIPNSIVIDRHFLLSSSFLKKSSILIVGDCLVNEADQKLCKALNAAGFKSKLLFGGISALYDGGYKLDMSLKGKAGLKQLSALELFRTRSYENVYFIVPEKFMAVAQYTFSNPVSGKFSKLPEYAQVISLVSEYGDQNYFQYDGGFEAYLDFLQHQRRLHSPDKVVKTTVGGKTTVKMNEECSTCP